MYKKQQPVNKPPIAALFIDTANFALGVGVDVGVKPLVDVE
jgi:hypothetical protein